MLHWVMSQSSWNPSKTFVVLQGIHANPGRDLVLCAGFVGRDLPSCLSRDLPSDAVRHFREGEVLTEDGNVSITEGGGVIPLSGLVAVWTPDTPDMLSELLKCYYKYVSSSEVKRADSGEFARQFQSVSPLEVAKALQDRRVLVFTGAGISMASGLPDLDELSALVESVFTPTEGFFDEAFRGTGADRLAKARRYLSLFTQSEPNRAHWTIAELCASYGWQLATGNFDGLHEKTGDEFRLHNPRGRVIAINPKTPRYLGPKDFLVNGTAEGALGDIQ